MVVRRSDNTLLALSATPKCDLNIQMGLGIVGESRVMPVISFFSGATSHMTPHHLWLSNYVLKHIQMKLAETTLSTLQERALCYSNPLSMWSRLGHLSFHKCNNLFSVLFLTLQKSFTVTIDATKMSFERPSGSPLFTASIADNNAAFLDGSTVLVVVDWASVVGCHWPHVIDLSHWIDCNHTSSTLGCLLCVDTCLQNSFYSYWVHLLLLFVQLTVN